MAGAETTPAAVANFLIAMIHHPHVMRKAQAELDKIVGRDRLPSFTDRQHLPYLCAIVKEVLRWRTPGPLGKYAVTHPSCGFCNSFSRYSPEISGGIKRS
jgi:cytochrome P450